MKIHIRCHEYRELNQKQLRNFEKCLNYCLENYQIDEIFMHNMFRVTKQILNILRNISNKFPEVKITFYSHYALEGYAKLKNDKAKKKDSYFYFDKIKTFNFDCYYPQSYIKLNYRLIDKADICIFFFDYKIIAKRAGITAHAYDYAKRKGKIVYNIAEKL